MPSNVGRVHLRGRRENGSSSSLQVQVLASSRTVKCWEFRLPGPVLPVNPWGCFPINRLGRLHQLGADKHYAHLEFDETGRARWHLPSMQRGWPVLLLFVNAAGPLLKAAGGPACVELYRTTLTSDGRRPPRRMARGKPDPSVRQVAPSKKSSVTGLSMRTISRPSALRLKPFSEAS